MTKIRQIENCGQLDIISDKFNDTNHISEDKKEDAIGFAFKKMDNIIMRHIHHKLAESGLDELTIMHGYIMGYIYNNQDKDIYQKDIESKFEIARSTVTNILKLMEKKGYLTRTTDETDTRLKRLALTELGVKKHEEAMVIIQSVHEQMEAGITTEEKKAFFNIISKIKNNINYTNVKNNITKLTVKEVEK